MNTSIFICELSQSKQDLIEKKVKRYLTLEGYTKKIIKEGLYYGTNNCKK